MTGRPYPPTPPRRPPAVPPRQWKSHWHPYPGGAMALPPDVARRWRDAGRVVVFGTYSQATAAATATAPEPAGQLELFPAEAA